MAASVIATLMGHTPLFAGLTPDERRELAHKSETRRYERDAVIFAQGTPAKGMFLVVTGLVKVFQAAPDGGEVVLHLIHPGHTLAEAAMFQQAVYPAYAQAVDASRLIYFPAESILKMLAAKPELALRMLASLSNRLREFARMLSEQQRGTAQTRVASWLLQHMIHQSRVPRVTLTMSRETLASALGLTRETLSRSLMRLHKDNVITVNKREITIRELEKLRTLASVEPV